MTRRLASATWITLIAIWMPLAALGAIAERDAPAAVEARAPVVTHHRGTFNGKKLRYTATVEGIDVPDARGKSAARLVTFTYVAEKVPDRTARPVLFVFNGGPITSSLWLHIGVMGPKRLAIPDDLSADPAGFALADNPYSPLDVADLVFIDPASTGYSRVLPEVAPESYYSVVADGQQVTAFISQWLATHGRTASPVYLLGESYGTVRAAEVAGQLVELPRPVLLDGVVLMGQAVNIVEYSQRPQSILSYVVSLPTLAALGWYHNKVDRQGKTLEQFVDDARNFAQSDYMAALFQGNALAANERDRVAQRLEALSGIPAKWYREHALRITKEQYRGELLKDRGLLLSRNDGRYVAPMADKGLAPDAFADAVMPAFSRAFADYMRNDLQVRWPDKYIEMAPIESLEAWHWGGTTPFSDWAYGERLQKAMDANPRFRVLIANGYYDTQTTVGAAELAVRQAHWPAGRASLAFYEGGHMPYTIEQTAKKFTDDLRTFMQPPR
jgi:carboxypeptidase C (cathepsin A)